MIPNQNSAEDTCHALQREIEVLKLYLAKILWGRKIGRHPQNGGFRGSWTFPFEPDNMDQPEQHVLDVPDSLLTIPEMLHSHHDKLEDGKVN